MCLKQRPEKFRKAGGNRQAFQSTEASNAIEGIVTTTPRIRQLVEEKPRLETAMSSEIAGHRDALNNIIHENFDAIPITRNYILAAS